MQPPYLYFLMLWSLNWTTLYLFNFFNITRFLDIQRPSDDYFHISVNYNPNTGTLKILHKAWTMAMFMLQEHGPSYLCVH